MTTKRASKAPAKTPAKGPAKRAAAKTATKATARKPKGGGEKTSRKVATAAAKLMRHPEAEVREVAASALTQANDRQANDPPVTTAEMAEASEIAVLQGEIIRLTAANDQLRQQLADQQAWSRQHGARA